MEYIKINKLEKPLIVKFDNGETRIYRNAQVAVSDLKFKNKNCFSYWCYGKCLSGMYENGIVEAKFLEI